jgi:hypothetical protein
MQPIEGRECNHPTCGATCRRPKNVKKTYTLKRTPLKKKPYRIAKMSEKRAEEMVLYKDMRVAFMKENKVCAAGLDGCTKKATDVHHMAGRTNAMLLDQTKWLAVCRNCHRQITDNSEMAIAKSLSISRTNVTEKVLLFKR